MPQCLFSIASVANFSYTNIFYYTLIAVQMLIYLFLFSNLENFPSCIMHVVWYDYDSFCESIFLGKAFKKVHVGNSIKYAHESNCMQTFFRSCKALRMMHLKTL